MRKLSRLIYDASSSSRTRTFGRAPRLGIAVGALQYSPLLYRQAMLDQVPFLLSLSRAFPLPVAFGGGAGGKRAVLVVSLSPALAVLRMFGCRFSCTALDAEPDVS
jgi:hypothetical protein